MKTTRSIYLLAYLVSLRVMTILTDTEGRVEAEREERAGKEEEEEEEGGAPACPPFYWDDPSIRCSNFLLTTLDSIHPENDFWFVPHVVNSTCSSWKRTNSCYKHLLHSCRGNQKARSELQMHSSRFNIFSLACMQPNQEDDVGDNKYVVDCFIPRMRRIMQCARSFDSVFRNYITEKSFRHACRVVSATMNCFNVIRSQIAGSCSDEVAARFVRTFVQPLADQSRSAVLKHCEMMPSYSEYFSSRAGSVHGASLTAVVSRYRCRCSCSCCCCCCCCLVLLFLVALDNVYGFAGGSRDAFLKNSPGSARDPPSERIENESETGDDETVDGGTACFSTSRWRSNGHPPSTAKPEAFPLVDEKEWNLKNCSITIDRTTPSADEMSAYDVTKMKRKKKKKKRKMNTGIPTCSSRTCRTGRATRTERSDSKHRPQ